MSKQLYLEQVKMLLDFFEMHDKQATDDTWNDVAKPHYDAIAKMGDTATEGLIEALSASSSIRDHIATLLVEIGSADAMNALEVQLPQETDPTVKSIITKALSQYKKPDPSNQSDMDEVNRLLAVFEEKNKQATGYTWNDIAKPHYDNIAKMGDTATQGLLEALRRPSGIRGHIAKLLVNIGSPTAIAGLEAQLARERDIAVRKIITDALI